MNILAKLKDIFHLTPKFPENSLLKIISRERVGDVDIIQGICKKKVTSKDIKPLTKVLEETYKTDAYVTIDPSDPYKLKLILKHN